MKIIEEWDLEFVQDVLERGLDYARRGYVMEEAISSADAAATATVEGRIQRSYKVKVGLDADGLADPASEATSCTCAHFAEGMLCKHIAAVCYVLEGDADLVAHGARPELRCASAICGATHRRRSRRPAGTQARSAAGQVKPYRSIPWPEANAGAAQRGRLVSAVS